MDLTEEQIKLIQIVEKFYMHHAGDELPKTYSTSDIFSRLQSIYPSAAYNPTDVYQVMTYMEFEYLHTTGNKILWLVCERLERDPLYKSFF